MAKKFKFQITSLKIKCNEAFFKWNIENFFDYAENKILTLNSEEIQVEDAGCKFSMSLTFDEATSKKGDQVEVEFKIMNDNQPAVLSTARICFYIFSNETCKEKIMDYSASLVDTSETFKKKFFYKKEWKKFLVNGTLHLNVGVFIKKVEVLNTFEEIKKEDLTMNGV